MLDVVAAGAAAAVEALAVFHADAEDASAVVSDLQIGVFLVDE